jgi:hypothetical protein
MKDFSNESPVLVKWEDPHGGRSTWHDINDLVPKPLICHSVGWAVRRENGCLVLMAHLAPPRSDGEQAGFGDVTIPLRAIRSIRPLSVKMKRKKKAS